MAKKNYENFPLSLAFFDALPVLFFGIAVLLIAIRFENILFITGAFLCTLAGLGKVIWKIIIAGTRKDIVWMNRQLRVLMPVAQASGKAEAPFIWRHCGRRYALFPRLCFSVSP